MPPEFALIPNRLRPLQRSGLVRLGAVCDGGYVISEEALRAADFLLSMGISTNWEFEKAFMAARHARGSELLIHAYDHSVDARVMRVYRMKTLARYALTGDTKWLAQWRQAAHFNGFFDGITATHFKERVWSTGQDGSVDVKTIMARIPCSRRIFVKMDIEGAEYRILADLADASERIVGLVVEYHDLDILRSNFENFHARLAAHYDVAHIHTNNVGGLAPDGFPNILEITYDHKSIVGHALRSDNDYPLPQVDKPNAVDLPDFRVRFV
jgi:hypothetical protein